MRKLFQLVAAFAMLAGVSGITNAAIIINEVYSGGGSSNAAASYTRDFVELYNTAGTNVDISGWSLRYASAGGNFTNLIVQFDPGTLIGANNFFTVVTGSANTGGATLTSANANIITPTTTASLSATTGSVSLFDASSNQVDVLGWGTLTTTSGTIVTGGTSFPKLEGTAATAGGISSSMNRVLFGDTNNNSADFITGTPSPTLGTVTAVPEPSSMVALAAVGVAGVVARRRRNKAAQA